jgi:two-component system, chemotaxis family, protein-glutamate methylesterase/glutaminase
VSSHKHHDFAETLSAPAPDNSGPLNVLVVDDSAIVRQVLMAVLSEKRGFRVSVAADPLIAMDKMKKFPPDVILLDL